MPFSSAAPDAAALTQGAAGPMTRAYLTAAAPRPANGYVPFHDPHGQIVYHHGYFRPDITCVQPADSARLTDRRWITRRTAAAGRSAGRPRRWEYRGAG